MCVSHSVVSDFLWLYGLYPPRLLCPWNSPGKNTGMCCHSLLQGIFPIQGSSLSLPHCRQILYLLRHQESAPLSSFNYSQATEWINCSSLTPFLAFLIPLPLSKGSQALLCMLHTAQSQGFHSHHKQVTAAKPHLIPSSAPLHRCRAFAPLKVPRYNYRYH